MIEEKVKIKVKVLGIGGSPRKNGNTEFLLKHALDAAKMVDSKAVETELYSIAGKTYLPCICCLGCAKTGYCVRGDKDDFYELRDKWIDSDAVILAVPVYHMSIPGQLKCFIDRLGNSLYSYYGSKIPKQLKIYAAIAQGTHIFSGQECAMANIINHALVMGNVVVSGDPWESYIGGGGWTKDNIQRDSLKMLYDKKDFDAEAAVKACRSLGKRVAELSLILKAGALHYIEYLKRDEMYKPFVERILKR